MEDYFFMVFVNGCHNPTYQHASLENAKAEAVRLSKLPDNQGKKVYVLSVVACCIFEPVQWLPIGQQDIPF